MTVAGRHLRHLAHRHRRRALSQSLHRGRILALGTAGAWAGSDYSGVTSTSNAVAATSDTFQMTGLIALPGIELPPQDRAPFIMRPFDQESLLCRRYWRKTFTYATAPASNAGRIGAWEWLQTRSSGGTVSPEFEFGIPMRAAPTATFYNPSASGSQTRNLDAGADCINTSADNASEDRLKVYTELPGGSGSTNLLSVHFTLSARL